MLAPPLRRGNPLRAAITGARLIVGGNQWLLPGRERLLQPLAFCLSLIVAVVSGKLNPIAAPEAYRAGARTVSATGGVVTRSTPLAVTVSRNWRISSGFKSGASTRSASARSPDNASTAA